MLKLNQQTVRNWIDRGQLSATRVGRRVRIRRSDLDRIVQAGYGRGGPGAGDEQGPSQSAEDFWSGEAVGVAVPPPLAGQP
jgi:excisionase family DNA binding protein